MKPHTDNSTEPSATAKAIQDDPQYQSFVESLVPQCNCDDKPCEGLLAGGLCDERCENCEDLATTYDTDGVPLCMECSALPSTANASETPSVIRVALISRHIDIDSEEDLKIRAWITAKASETLTLETLSALFDDWCKSAEFDLYEIDPTEPEKQRALRDAYGLIEESLNKGKALESELSTLRVELAKARKETEALCNELYGGVHSCSDSCSRPACRFRRERDAAIAQLATAREALLKIAPRIRGELFESHPERIALEAALADMEAKDGSQ